MERICGECCARQEMRKGYNQKKKYKEGYN
jgi:hypothetical protein